MAANATFMKMAKLAAEKTGLPERFLAAWMAAENGYMWPSTNNPGNISWNGTGEPMGRGGIWTGAVRVESNRVVVYDTPEHGTEAWCELINLPTHAHGGSKALTVDTEDLKEAWAKGGVELAAKVLGESNWAASHYDDGGGPGSLIIGAYHSSVLNEWFGSTSDKSSEAVQAAHTSASGTSKATEPERTTYKIKPGDTLSAIGLRFGIPYRVLARFNHIANPNVIQAGATLRIPKKYKIKPGDTLSQICVREGYPLSDVNWLAQVNGVNPNLIYAGRTLYV
ncbi:LysM peptidoglycan-binding domain-containing protein [Alicyclobacillus kakegawensis]|uniref:LysM peptidoglycan-binding domain-containing protein n=1 Tax=Alicyclobacillus kakegawensis TaxID=392012 RepID=UPI0008374F48|nr:LysM peptidoglycan-binding domain-containing protein [Alicyclobacillus kakegawensis]